MKNNETFLRHGIPVSCPVDSDENFLGGGGGDRRKFLKRTGGATAATFMAWSAASAGRANAEENGDHSDEKTWILVCTSDPWDGPLKSTDDSWHGGELEVSLTATAGPEKGDTGGGNISSGASCSQDHNITGAGSFANIATITQSVTMQGEAVGPTRPTVKYTPPKIEKQVRGTEFSFDGNGAPDGGPEPDLALKLILENGCLFTASTWDGNAFTVEVTLSEGQFGFALNGSMEASVSYIWTFEIMDQDEYDQWKSLNP